MTTNLPVIPADVPTHDNTMMTAAMKCLRLYKERYRNHWTSKERAVPLSFGALMHLGLNVWYKTKDPDKALMALVDANYVDPPGDHRTRGLAITILAESIEWYGDERRWWGDDVILNETAINIEDEDGFRWGGRLDLLVRYKGSLWVVDHKTTSIGTDRWWDEYLLSPQMGGYVYSAGVIAGAPIAGVIINRIIIPKNKLPPEKQFKRRPFLWDANKLAEWRRQMIHNYHQIYQAIETGDFPPNWYACIGRYGRCSRYGICTLPANSRERANRADFTQEPWDWNEVNE